MSRVRRDKPVPEGWPRMLTRARRKPAWCSDVRWRIETRRRAMRRSLCVTTLDGVFDDPDYRWR